MYVQVQNDEYGKAVATYGDYVVVANPPSLRWNAATSSIHYTGSIDYFRYNKSTDQHDYVATLIKPPEDINALLTTEDNNAGITGPRYYIQTENANWYANSDLLIDKNAYTSSVEDGYGTSLDMYQKILVVGSPYFTEIIKTYALTITASGASVNIYNLANTEYPMTGSEYVISLYNPDINFSQSFGQAVSINNSWIAVGSPLVSGSDGAVYMFQNVSPANSFTSWSLYQVIQAPATGSKFGWSLKLNKQSGSISHSMVVGCGNLTSGQAYYYEFVSGSWIKTFTFYPTTDIQPLTFANYLPYNPVMNISNGFGYSVSTFDNAVIVGEPYDRNIYEYSGSDLYQQGSAYIFERCPNTTARDFSLVLKTYGTPTTLKNNLMGYSVDIFGGNAVVGIPKLNDLSSCYVEGTLEQLHLPNDEVGLVGQAMLLQKNTSSMAWDVCNVYQKKKRFFSPYRDYADAVAIADKSMVIGAPILFQDSSRVININATQSNNVTLDDITGKAYIYNLKNLRNKFHVGNVFYRNGKVILMTSGSIFDGVFFNPVSSLTYEYDLKFQGEHTIFEKQIICSVDPGEFNVSTNPTAISRPTSSFDVNSNGRFDFQDADVLLRYMQYKNTSFLGLPVSTDWSSSLVSAPDEISLLKYYQSNGYDAAETATLTSQSIVRWEQTDTWMQELLDLNQDNKIDIRDMSIMWKYFSNRLTQKNYATYITPACKRKLFSDVLDYLNFVSKRDAAPQIKAEFLDYERSVALDKTGSYLAPMVTTIGLYSGLDLVAVAKLGTPVKIIPELPFNFVIKMDY